VLHLVVISPIRKEKKRNINNDLAVLLSHDTSLGLEFPLRERFGGFLESKVEHLENMKLSYSK